MVNNLLKISDFNFLAWCLLDSNGWALRIEIIVTAYLNEWLFKQLIKTLEYLALTGNLDINKPSSVILSLSSSALRVVKSLIPSPICPADGLVGKGKLWMLSIPIDFKCNITFSIGIDRISGTEYCTN
eukprot:NODE_61_length_25240_cov_0.547194.p14 type:complete len:128 gc:universal NODE_61_length_25240_cov_0.547194:22854-23237(+)